MPREFSRTWFTTLHATAKTCITLVITPTTNWVLLALCTSSDIWTAILWNYHNWHNINKKQRKKKNPLEIIIVYRQILGWYSSIFYFHYKTTLLNYSLYFPSIFMTSHHLSGKSCSQITRFSNFFGNFFNT